MFPTMYENLLAFTFVAVFDLFILSARRADFVLTKTAHIILDLELEDGGSVVALHCGAASTNGRLAIRELLVRSAAHTTILGWPIAFLLIFIAWVIGWLKAPSLSHLPSVRHARAGCEACM